MAVGQQTYSFQAPVDFGERLMAAQAALPGMLADEDRARDFHHELGIALARRGRALGGRADGSQVAHLVLDALVVTTERALEDVALTAAPGGGRDPEGDAWRRAATQTMLERDD